MFDSLFPPSFVIQSFVFRLLFVVFIFSASVYFAVIIVFVVVLGNLRTKLQ